MSKNVSSSPDGVQISFNRDPSRLKLHSDTELVGFFGTYQELACQLLVEVICNLVVEESTAREDRQGIY